MLKEKNSGREKKKSQLPTKKLLMECLAISKNLSSNCFSKQVKQHLLRKQSYF